MARQSPANTGEEAQPGHARSRNNEFNGKIRRLVRSGAKTGAPQLKPSTAYGTLIHLEGWAESVFPLPEWANEAVELFMASDDVLDVEESLIQLRQTIGELRNLRKLFQTAIPRFEVQLSQKPQVTRS